MRDIAVDTVFVGSCTNGRIEDLRAAAHVIEGRHVADSVRMLVVPGSSRVRLQAEDEGLDVVFKEAGAEWRGAGCSMCLGMNPDQLAPGERSASTSNRNFEGRQGKGGRTHLVSPLVAAATAVVGRLASPADLATGEEAIDVDAFTTHTGTAVAAARGNVDTDQIIPAEYLKRDHAHWLRGRALRGLAQGPDVRAEPSRQYDGASILVAGPGLRHRIVARACGVGLAGLRIQGRDRLSLR